jgi:hypothetical protein
MALRWGSMAPTFLPSDRFSRFIHQKGDYSVDNNKVKANAFNPPRTSSRLSIFLTESLTEKEIWTIAENCVDDPPNKVTKARGDLKESVVTSAGLTIDFDDNPPRHANILGWPQEKSERMLLAKKISDPSVLVVKPTP